MKPWMLWYGGQEEVLGFSVSIFIIVTWNGVRSRELCVYVRVDLVL